MAKTGEEVGFENAMRQIRRSLQRRQKALEEELSDAADKQREELRVRLEEVHHLLDVVNSMHW